MRLSSVLGIDSQSLRVKEFEYGGKTFKVKVPTSGEHQALVAKIEATRHDSARIQEIYLNRIAGLQPSEVVLFQNDDVIVDGRSMREAAMNELLSNTQITAFFNLLVKEVDDGLGDLTYEQINAELPIAIQLEMMKRIAEAISPRIEDAKKN